MHFLTWQKRMARIHFFLQITIHSKWLQFFPLLEEWYSVWYIPPGITRGELAVSYSKLAEISRNSRGLYWWDLTVIIISQRYSFFIPIIYYSIDLFLGVRPQYSYSDVILAGFLGGYGHWKSGLCACHLFYNTKNTKIANHT